MTGKRVIVFVEWITFNKWFHSINNPFRVQFLGPILKSADKNSARQLRIAESNFQIRGQNYNNRTHRLMGRQKLHKAARTATWHMALCHWSLHRRLWGIPGKRLNAELEMTLLIKACMHACMCRKQKSRLKLPKLWWHEDSLNWELDLRENAANNKLSTLKSWLQLQMHN